MLACIYPFLLFMLGAAVLGYLMSRFWGNESEDKSKFVDYEEHSALQSRFDHLKAQHSTLKTENTKLEEQLSEGTGKTHSMGVKLSALQLDNKALRDKNMDLTNDIFSLKGQLEAVAGGGNLDAAKLKSENQKLLAELQAAKSSRASKGTSAEERKKRQEEMIHRIMGRKGEVDFSRVTAAKPGERDNLKRLKGLGALVEKKMNALGIYTFRQIANFNQKDETHINGLLELPKNKITKEGWVWQARVLAGMISDWDAAVGRVGARKDRINFDRIGKASKSRKDDLQAINGIGPFIEAKLNALGIYTFAQLTKLTARDMVAINEAIELTPGHLQRDDWVGQAKGMVKA